MKILFVGDIVIYEADKFAISERLKELFNEHDICACNVEAPIANSETDRKILKAGPNICQGKKSIDCLANAGFNLVSLANNHIMDYGEIGLKNTCEAFNEKNIPTIGAGFTFDVAYKPYIFEKDAKKFAFIGLSQAEFGVFKHKGNGSGYAWINHPEINKMVSETKKKVDFVYIIAHAGVEQIPYPLPEWQTRYRELIDCGADCIIGSHPHIVQGYETYKNKHIFYSIGNFYFNKPEKTGNAWAEWNRSLVISMNTENPDELSVIPVSIKNSVVDFDDSSDFERDIKTRCDLLIDPQKYLVTMNEIAEKLWNDRYRNYYIQAVKDKTNIQNMSLKQIVNYSFLLIISKIRHLNTKEAPELNNTMLLHNIQIESHRWIVERYLYNCNLAKNKSI